MYLITGVSSGIGKFLFDNLTAEGFIVYGTYNKTPPEEINRYLSKVDINDFDSVLNWYKILESNLSQIVLINNAGISYSSFAHKSDIKKWSNVINTNLIGTFNVIRAFLPFMRNENYGRIINFSSVVAQIGVSGTSAYAASKAGLWGLTKALAKENGNKGITINNVNLGYTNTGIIRDVPEKEKVKILENIPSGKFCNPQEIYNTIKYIIKTPYLNGTSIDLNGGLF